MADGEQVDVKSAKYQIQLVTAAKAITASGLQTLAELNTTNVSEIYVQMTPDGDAFTAFTIQAEPTGEGDYETFFNTAGQFTTPPANSKLIGTNGLDLTTLADGVLGSFILNTRSFGKVKLQATGAASITVKVVVNGEE